VSLAQTEDADDESHRSNDNRVVQSCHMLPVAAQIDSPSNTPLSTCYGNESEVFILAGKASTRHAAIGP
jgi:hypothetical protein